MRIGARLLLLGPALVLVTLVLVVPVGRVVLSSFGDDSGDFAANYREVFADPLLLRSLWVTLWLTVLTVVATVALGYPLAYTLNALPTRRAALLMSLVLVPFWTSITVKSFAFIIVLGRRGLVNDLLIGSGAIDRPVDMLFNSFSVVVGLAHIALPLMVLPLYAAMRRIDTSLVQAASSLGAGSFRAFWEVFLPLSLPGVAAGSTLVFMTTIGAYVTPALLGGKDENMVAQFIIKQVNVFFDLPLAGALTVVLLLLTILSLAVASRGVGLQRLWPRGDAA